jgi:hypothetical protein
VPTILKRRMDLLRPNDELRSEALKMCGSYAAVHCREADESPPEREVVAPVRNRHHFISGIRLQE